MQILFKNPNTFVLDVYESVRRDTIVKITNKMHCTD
jgi:hypothetical protein